MSWLKDMFGVSKPIIAMCHLQALPGDPSYDRAGGMARVVELALHDLLHLQDGGVDAVMFSNEFSLPYLTKVRPETTVAMARVIGELRHRITVPFGVNVLWDAVASIDLAAATGALFMREVITGVYASDFGLWNTNVGETVRHKMALAPDLRLLFNIVPEAAAYLGTRTVIDIARSTVFNNRPDALCVSGLTAGAEADTEVLSQVKAAVPDTGGALQHGLPDRQRRAPAARLRRRRGGHRLQAQRPVRGPRRPRPGASLHGQGPLNSLMVARAPLPHQLPPVWGLHEALAAHPKVDGGRVPRWIRWTASGRSFRTSRP